MSIKTVKPKANSKNGISAKDISSSNGSLLKLAKRKKSINERWIEKYGVDDSEAARKFRKAWKMAYEAHKQSKT
ncbi:MAG: hypothetical protein ACKVRN_15735 [Pyrinomonadaceae bacterium]